MYAVPDDFASRPFHRAEAIAAGISRHVLQGPSFVRLHQGVYRHRLHVMSFADEVAAARLALPDQARTTGITRIQELGIDFGPRRPLHFVIEGDHHLALDEVFLHRTLRCPPTDEGGVRAEAAWAAYCAEARTIDAIKVGCVLANRRRLDLGLLEQLLTEEPWRRGVAEARWVVGYLDERCVSLPEAEVLTMMRFAGLPEPDVNVPLQIDDRVLITPDFWFAAWRRAVEYEGSQHQTDRDQYTCDIDRYALYRRNGADYLQVTKELARIPKELMRRVHRLLVEGGYAGAEPDFEGTWLSLFLPLHDVVRPRVHRQR